MFIHATVILAFLLFAMLLVMILLVIFYVLVVIVVIVNLSTIQISSRRHFALRRLTWLLAVDFVF